MLLIPFIVIYIFMIPQVYKKCGKNTQKAILVLFAIELAVMAYFFLPKYDLGENFRFIASMQKNNISITDFWKMNIPGFEIYNLYLVFDFLCYIVIKIGNYHVLPFVCILIDYIIWGYITYDWNKKYKKSLYCNNLALIASWSMTPFIFAACGLRNVLAMSLVALAIYWNLEKNQKLMRSIVLVIIAMLIHPSALFPVLFWILAKGKKNKLKVIFTIVAIIIENSVILLATSSNNEIVQMLAYRLMAYTGENQYTNSRSYLVVDLVYISAFVIAVLLKWIIKKRTLRNLEYFFLLYGIFIIGNLMNYDMVLRPSYLIGCLSAPFIFYTMEGVMSNRRWVKVAKIILKSVIYALCIYELQLNYQVLVSLVYDIV